MKLVLSRTGDAFVWKHGRKQFGPPLADTAAAVRFLKEVSGIYNYTLELATPLADFEQQ
ncbi:MAG: hypothetical protein IT158_23040 [Bryobacterales bacterium]|nr:hypothetical protein [Bryobacterales bacterium]